MTDTSNTPTPSTPISTVKTAVSGYKTYIVAALYLIYILSAFFTGHITGNEAANGIAQSAALASIRSALTTYLGPLAGFALDRLIGDLGAFLDQERSSLKLTSRRSSYDKRK